MRLAVSAIAPPDESVARALAQGLQLPLLPIGTDHSDCELADALLLVNGPSLQLQQTGRGAPGPVQVDFGSGAMRHRRRSGGNELLGRAIGCTRKPGLHVLDATAGLGRDGFVLADMGCRISLCERAPVVHALLHAGLETARSCGDPWLAEVLPRMQLLQGDSTKLPADCLQDVDVIYLDPMFPQRDKRAAVKKEMALLQVLFQADDPAREGASLLSWALAQAVARVVVKRPARASVLEGEPPSHCISGKAVRYDVYVRHKLA